MTRRRVVCVSACCFLNAGCTIWTNTFPPSPPGQVRAVPAREGAIVLLFRDSCPVTKVPAQPVFALAPLAVAVISAGITAVTTAVENYVQKTKTNLTATYTADGTGSLQDNQGYLAEHCLVIANGRFGPPETNLTDAGALNPGVLTQVGLANYPKLYIEFWITEEQVDKDSRVIIEPRLLEFNNTEAKNPGNGVKDINVVLTMSSEPESSTANTPPAPAKPAAPAAGLPVAAAGPVEKPKTGAPASNASTGNTSALTFVFPKVKWGTFTEATGSGSSGNPFYNQRRVTTVAAKGPLNLHAVISETDDSSAFTDVIISTLPQGAKTIDDALVSAIQKGLGVKPAAAAAK